MRILPLGYTAPKIDFGAKKTLYANYDGTYFPFERWQISRSNALDFSNMYLPFDTFKKSDDEFNIVVTTGRNMNDYVNTENQIQEANINYCTPDKIITSNGANVFKLNNNRGKIEAIDITETDSDQYDAIEKAIEISKEVNPDILHLECGSNGLKETHGESSLETVIDKLGPKGRSEYISVARDGKNCVEIVFSKGADDDTAADKIQDYLEETGAPFTVEHYENSPYTIVPEYEGRDKKYVCANLILVKRKGETGSYPDKFDTIKKEVKKAMEEKNGDMVIVASGSAEDEKMLNPMNYLDLIGLDKKDTSNPKLLNEGPFIQGFKRLPLRIIVTGDDPSLNHIRELAGKFEERRMPNLRLAPNTKTDFPKVVGDILKEEKNK